MKHRKHLLDVSIRPQTRAGIGISTDVAAVAIVLLPCVCCCCCCCAWPDKRCNTQWNTTYALGWGRKRSIMVRWRGNTCCSFLFGCHLTATHFSHYNARRRIRILPEIYLLYAHNTTPYAIRYDTIA